MYSAIMQGSGAFRHALESILIGRTRLQQSNKESSTSLNALHMSTSHHLTEADVSA